MNKILWFVSMLFTVAQAQTLIVENQENNQPIELATISSNQPLLYTTTNSKGEANITEFVGVEIIEIRSMGYEAQTLSYQKLKESKFEIKLKPQNFSLEGVIVSATKWQQNSKEVPGKITSISAKQVGIQNPQTAADLLGSSGEVFIQKSQQGGGSPMIRGFSTNRLLYSVDGVRMNTAIFRSGNLQNVISLDAFSIENTEVLFGPGSVIYGSDAIGGVMSFSTLKPQFSANENVFVKGSAVGRFASANKEKTGHFDVNVGWKKWAFLTSFTYTDYDDLRMGSNGPEEYLKKWNVLRIDSTDVVVTNEDPLVQNPTGFSQINMMQKLSFKPNNDLQLDYGFHYSTTTSYGRYDRHIRTRNGLPRSAEWDYGPQTWMMNQFTLAYSKSNLAFDQVNLRLAHQFFEESRTDRNFNSSTKSYTKEKVFAYSVNVDFVKSIFEKHKVFYGVEFVNDVIHSEGEEEDITTGVFTTAPSRYPISAWASAAAYANYQYKHSDKLTFQTGLRYGHFLINADFSNNQSFYDLPESRAKLSNGAVTGSAGLIYSPNETTILRANFSTGFRAPNIDDIGKIFDSEPGSVVVPNTDLKSEYVYNGEIGFAKVIKKTLKIDGSAYYMLLKNAMVRRDFNLNGLDSILYQGTLSQVQAIQNAAQANVYGVQVGIEAKLPKGFGLNGVYNYQRGREELDNGEVSASRHAAPMFGAFHVSYKYDKLFMDLYTMFSGGVSFENLPEGEKGKPYLYAIDDNGNPYSPAWATLNLKAIYQINKNFNVSAGLENILDQRYKTYSSGIVAPGRNFILSAKASF